MSYQIGDPNHLLVHRELITQLRAMGATTLPAEPSYGAPGHVADHQAIITALQEIAAAWGVTGTPLPPVKQAGELGHVDDHNAIDAAIAYLYANGYNSAAGGIVSYYTDGDGDHWACHTFTAAGSLEVQRSSKPFRILLVGGGAAGTNGGGNGGTVLANDSATIPAGTHAVTIGNGGFSYGDAGGATALGALFSAPGGSGAGGQISGGDFPRWDGGRGNGGAGQPNNGNGGPGAASDITGQLLGYGGGGGGGALNNVVGSGVDGGGNGGNSARGTDGTRGGGGGGGGPNLGSGASGVGGGGICAVAYQVPSIPADYVEQVPTLLPVLPEADQLPTEGGQ